MKKNIVITLLIILGVSFASLTNAQEKSKTDSKKVKTEVKTEKIQKDEAVSVTEGKPVNSICPVSGEDLDPSDQQLVKYKGEVIAVCCKKCEKKIKADPEKYLKKLKRDEKAESK